MAWIANGAIEHAVYTVGLNGANFQMYWTDGPSSAFKKQLSFAACLLGFKNCLMNLLQRVAVACHMTSTNSC